MTGRTAILAGMAAGLAWAGVLALAEAWLRRRGIAPEPLEALAWALAPAGAVMAAMIATLARRRFLDPALREGAPFEAPSDRITQAALRNHVEQTVLAVACWPLVAATFGGAAIIALGVGFGLTRLAFWIGYLRAPELRAFGFAGSFYPTVLALAAAILATLA